MTRVGTMRACSDAGWANDRATLALARATFGPGDYLFEEPHGFWWQVLNGLLLPRLNLVHVMLEG